MSDINNRILIIQNGTQVIPDEAYMDSDTIEEVIIPDSVIHIGVSAFKGCRHLKKVTLSNNLTILDAFAFSECESLEEITIPNSLHYFSYGVFSHCHNLKKISWPQIINYIDDIAFYNCQKLENIFLPEGITSIGKKAFFGCATIREIHIPSTIDTIELGAFSMITNLSKITVSEDNKKFFSCDDDTILIAKDGIIIQYAINCERDEFIIGYYNENMGYVSDEVGNVIPLDCTSLIYNIGDYAFAGAKNLKKIYLPSEVESIGGNTFKNCPNLKELEVFHTNFGNSFLLNVYTRYNESIEIPFENITIHEGIVTLCGMLSELFKNAKNISLPSSLEQISEEVFTKSSLLKKITLPDRIKMIAPHTFYPDIDLVFNDMGTIKAYNFNMLQTKTSDDYYVNQHNKGNIRIFSLNDGTYYVKIDDYDTVKINKDEIIKLSSSSKVIADSPDDFVMYLIKLLSINGDSNRLLTSIWTDKKLTDLFLKFVSDCHYIEEIANKKTSHAIREILDNGGIYDEFLFTGMMMRNLSKDEITKIIKNFNPSIDRFFRYGIIYEDKIIDINALIAYCNILEKYQRYDKFFYNPIFFEKLSLKNQELLIKYYNKNIKHLLNNSSTIDDTYGVTLNDLLNLCNALGVFSDDEKVNQQMATFINEKMFNPESPTYIKKDTIHSMFNDLNPRDEIDYEFITFFIDNFIELLDLEKKKSGIISRIYNTFREISKTSTSHRGSQRHLKVTIEKCLDYFLAERFDGVNEDNIELAKILQKFYSEPYVLSISEMIINQSMKAPRNIFTKIEYDNDPIYSYDETEDLKESNTDNFSYEWLPKQSYDNLILGKYCSCCAHILGAGAGIMRASMILDNCQNLVIRNKDNIIIAKMTIYVNRENGYAVFNTAEVNTAYQNEEMLSIIYQAFMRGVKAFLYEYNKNNDIPITLVTIGEYRNTLKNLLGNIETPLLETPNYSSYGYYVNDKCVGTYDGDSKQKQILVLKK